MTARDTTADEDGFLELVSKKQHKSWKKLEMKLLKSRTEELKKELKNKIQNVKMKN